MLVDSDDMYDPDDMKHFSVSSRFIWKVNGMALKIGFSLKVPTEHSQLDCVIKKICNRVSLEDETSFVSSPIDIHHCGV